MSRLSSPMVPFWRCVFSLVVSTVLACGSGATGHAVEPATPRVADARGAGAREASFYAADWPSEMRGDLEIALRKHVVVLAYDGKQVGFLPECVLDGNYTFEAVGLKEDVVRLRTADEVAAALPFAGAALGAKLEANAKSGATLDLATVLVGKTTASRADYRHTDLRGRCEGATHFVRSATRGAFVLTTGTRGEVRAAAELFANVSGASSSSRVAESHDGALEACRLDGGDEAPLGCRAVLRIEALPLLRGSNAASERTKYYAGWPKNCTSENDCAAKCELADMNSCTHRALLMRTRSPHDPRDVQSLLRRACDGADALGCFHLGGLYRFGKEGLPTDPVKAESLTERACDLGAIDACVLSAGARAHEVLSQRRSDSGPVLARLEELCASDVVPSPGGMGEPCFLAAQLHEALVESPPHDPKHLERAIALLERAGTRAGYNDRISSRIEQDREHLAHLHTGTVTHVRSCPGSQPQGTHEGAPCPSKPCGHNWYVRLDDACPTLIECTRVTSTPRTEWVPPEWCPPGRRVRRVE